MTKTKCSQCRGPGHGTRSHIPQLRVPIWDFPSGPVDKNSPANERDVDSIPGPERSHMTRTIKLRNCNY